MAHRDEDLIFVPEHFSGRARLFPLPNLVLFPHVIQPLRVFEPRYVDLLHEALEGDRLIAMALLEPGWEQDYEGRPPVAPVACLGRVLTWQATQPKPNLQYNLLLVALTRVRIVRELPPERSFREAEVEVVSEVYSPGKDAGRPALQASLISAFQEMLPRVDDACELFNQVSSKNVSLATLTDVISYALDLDVRAKQSLLEEANVDLRAEALLAHLKRAARGDEGPRAAAGFPPAFSTN
jgi:ATP-dependent Lon protease